MTRHSFLKSLATVAIAASIPADTLHAIGLGEAARERCLDILLRLWQKETKGKPPRTVNFHVGRQFFEAMEGELVACQRFTHTSFPERSLMFKNGSVKQVGEGWGVRVV